MITNLKDLTINSFIGTLPEIINYNNQSIKDSFSYIFDVSRGCYTHDLINPTGQVKAHWGEFVNITTETLQIKDASSLFNNAFKGISHNQWSGRFMDSSTKWNENYCHNIEAIQGLSEKLLQIDSSINEFTELYKKLTFTNKDNQIYKGSEAYQTGHADSNSDNSNNSNGNSYKHEWNDASPGIINVSDGGIADIYGIRQTAKSDNQDLEYINILSTGNSVDEYQYSKDMLTTSKAEIKKSVVNKSDYKDLANGKLYVYVNVSELEGTYVLVTNESDYAFNTVNKGQIIRILFKKGTSNKDFRIKLTYHNEKHAVIKYDDADSTELALICYDIDKQGQALWRIYGKDSFGNIQLI